MGLTLYEINERIEELTSTMIDPETGEILEEVLAEIDQLNMDMDEKLENIGIVIKSVTAEVDALKAEEKALKRRIEVRMNKIDRLSEYVNNILRGTPKKYTRVEYGYRRSQSVDVVNEEIVPNELCRFETKRTPMKADIKKLLKDGKNVPGCVLVEKNNLNIK